MGDKRAFFAAVIALDTKPNLSTRLFNPLHFLSHSVNRIVLSSIVLLSLGFGAAASAAPRNQSFPKLPFYERFVAIDNACGWPQVTVLPNGNLACLIWPHPVHGFIEGAAECWVSEDGGRFWKKTGVPVPNAPKENRMNLAGGMGANGEYVALVSGWDNRLPSTWKPDPDGTALPKDFFAGANTLNPIPAVSKDGGKTWQQFPVFDGKQPSGQGIIPFGRIAPLSDGTLGAIMYRDEVGFFVSGDNGRSWQKRGQLSSNRSFNETAWLLLENGEIFAASRAYGMANGGEHGGGKSVAQHLDGFRSTDGGRTWKNEGALTLPLQHPADLTRLPDGRILLSYGVRNDGVWAIHVRVGDATARNWSGPIALVDLEGSTDEPNRAAPRRDGGYPSTVVLGDGTLVTAYYSQGVPTHQRYHVGVVRWKLPELPDDKKRLLP